MFRGVVKFSKFDLCLKFSVKFAVYPIFYRRWIFGEFIAPNTAPILTSILNFDFLLRFFEARPSYFRLVLRARQI